MELAPVVGVERDDLPWVPVETRLQGSDHVDLCFRPDGSCLCPSGRLIGHCEDPVEISRCLSSIMPYEVHGQGTRNIQRRVHAGLNGDPATKRNTPGMTDPVQTVHLPFSSKESSDGGRTHLEKESSGLLIHMEMSMEGQVLHEESHPSRQADGTQEGAGCPDTDQCLLHIGAILGRTVPVNMLRRVSD